MKKQVMATAWNIAREAAAKHGGSAKEYISAAMKQAWAAAKAPVEEVVEAAPVKVKKAPKKKKSTGEIDFSKWMRGINENFQVSDAPVVEAPKEPKKPVVRKTETAAEKRARRAANPEMYAAKKVAPKAKKNGVGIDFSAWMRGINEMDMGQ